ncbi:MAG: hypothetical protein AAGA20_15785 [Planctomycetota bacterium]
MSRAQIPTLHFRGRRQEPLIRYAVHIALRALAVLLPLVAIHGTATGQVCPTCVPLNDLGSGTHEGETGGLYPGGANTPPAAHAAAELRAARSVVPRDVLGVPDPDGLVGVLSIGVSSFAQEWREVTRAVDADPQRNGHLVLINGAINAATTNRLRDPQAPHWTILDKRIQTAGVAPGQIQVAFIETSRHHAAGLTFPDTSRAMSAELGLIVRELKVRFPQLQIAFVTSLIYAGYSTTGVAEPSIYEDAFAVKWLIEDQIAGDPGLVHDPRSGAVRAPVLAWGPYLWANGAIPRSDGLVWLPSDLEIDGFHPNDAGEAKVRDLYVQFFDTSPAARAIFGARSGVTRRAHAIDADASLDASRPTTALGAEATLDVDDPNLSFLVGADVAAFAGTIRHSKLALEPIGRAGELVAIGVSDAAWDEATVTAGTAPAFDGLTSGELTITSEKSLAEWDVTPWTQEAVTSSGGRISFGIEKTTPSLLSQLYARESGRPAWLAVTIDSAPGGVEPFCPGLVGSVGAPALLGWTGDASLASADLAFHASDLPAATVVLPLVGTSSVANPLSGGDVCVGGLLTRLPLTTSNDLGRATFAVDWTAPGTSVVPGDTRTVQAVFRDTVVEGYRTTSAVVVTFRP